MSGLVYYPNWLKNAMTDLCLNPLYVGSRLLHACRPELRPPGRLNPLYVGSRLLRIIADVFQSWDLS